MKAEFIAPFFSSTISIIGEVTGLKAHKGTVVLRSIFHLKKNE